MPMPGGWELVLILVVLVLLFGAKKLPDMARSIGQSARVFKGEMKGMKDDEPAKDAPAPTPPAAQIPAAQVPAAAPVPPVPPQAATTDARAATQSHNGTGQ